ASANLLTDAGFDTQSVSELSWSTSPWWGGNGAAGGSASGGGVWITGAKANSPTHSSTLYLYGTDAYAWAVVGQTISSGIVGGASYTASAKLLRDASLASSEALFKIEWLNAGGTTLSTSTGTVKFNDTYTANVWNSVSENFTANPSAVGAKYEIVFSRDAAGNDPGDIWADDSNFDVIPEPTSMILLGSGLLGLFGISRKKRS
ncbi:MAG: PEP-CTERM sorting domain-containing protein, partial [Candidatus Omnitrophota bacterium]|nr:PEP-CTERM sorting domain-containing protein [Candidatus Omnitrophota bacterium]